MAGIERDDQDEFNIMDFDKKWTFNDTIWDGKKKLIRDFGRLKIIEDHAVQAPPSLCNDIDDLVSHLIHIANDTFEKYRVLFQWMAHNIKHETGDKDEDQQCLTESILIRGTAFSGGYAGLFNELCKRAGLDCKSVQGRSKAKGFIPGDDHGMAYKDRILPNHSWNEIKIGGVWYHCDCSWAAGYFLDDDETESYVSDWGEVWFITDPIAFQESHFSFEGIDKYISKGTVHYKAYKQWVNGPFIEPAFWGYGMKRISYENGVIEAVNNQVHVMFRMSYPMHIFHSLKPVSEPGKELMNCVIYYTDGDKIVVKAHLPHKGEYDFKIYGYLEDTGKEVQKSYRNNLIGYRIVASGWKHQPPFPDDGKVGPEWNFLKAGHRLTSPSIPIIEAKEGKACLTIERRKGPIKPMDFEFCHNSDLNDDLTTCVFPETSKKSVKVHMLCQRPGQYKLKVRVQFDDKSNTFEYGGCFLVYSSSTPPNPLEEFPKGNSQQWGPTKTLLDAGVDVLFPHTSLLTTDVADVVQGDLVIRCSKETYKRLNIQYDILTSNGVEVNDYAMAKVVFDKGWANVSFHFRLKKTGFYLFKLWHLRETGSDRYHLDGQWLLRCDKPFRGTIYPTYNRVYGPNILFYDLDLDLVFPMTSYIEALNGEGDLVIKCKRVTYEKLDMFLKAVTDNPGDKKAENSVLGEATFEEGFVTISFSFRLVEQGLTVFQLCARSCDWESEEYSCAGEWLIDCRNTYKGRPFPKFDQIYGPNWLFKSLGLQLVSPMTTRIVSNNGEARLVVRCSLSVYRKLTLFHEAIVANASIQNCIHADASFEGDVVTVSFKLRLANHGFTSMHLSANTDGSIDARSAGVWLVECRKPYQGQLFQDFNRVHGPNFAFFSMGVELMSPKSSVIDIKKGKGKLVVKYNQAEILDIYSKANCDGLCVTNSKESSCEGDSVVLTFHLNLANMSFKTVDLWAKCKAAGINEHVGKWTLNN